MYKQPWNDVADDQVRHLWSQGLHDEEIGNVLGRTRHAIAARRQALECVEIGRHRPLQMYLSPVHFPMFEDITKAEARLITLNAPQSARWTVEKQQSLMGITAAMCLEAKR